MHAQIVQEGERFRVRDLDSKNGTYVNGIRITGEGRVLRSGDRIELAEGQVFFEVPDPRHDTHPSGACPRRR